MINQELISFLAPDQISTDPTTKQIYGKDWTKHFTPNPSLILFPRTTDEVAKIVKWARKSGFALVPSGGRTGLSGGACALNGEVVVSFDQMRKISNFSKANLSVHCEAGVITEELQKYALSHGAYYPVDFASRGSSQIGGNIATNAGGIKVLRYGLTRNWILGLTVVTGAGEILELNQGLIKNATGYDLRHLFIGSEGTLGFVTEATIQLAPAPKDTLTAVVGLKDLSAIMTVFQDVRNSLPLLAYEMWTQLALDFVHKGLHHPKPFATDCEYYVLFEIELLDGSVEEKALSLIEHLLENGLIQDAVVGQNPTQSQNLWKLREDITEATSYREPYKNDISVTVENVPAFLNEVSALFEKSYPQFEVVWFGHIGDGNLHISVLKPESLPSPDFLSMCKSLDEMLYASVHKFRGSISAEHGVGLTKKNHLAKTRSTAEIQLMREIKKVFDPDGIMNPGKVL